MNSLKDNAIKALSAFMENVAEFGNYPEYLELEKVLNILKNVPETRNLAEANIHGGLK